MKIAIIIFEEPWFVLASTSLINGLVNTYKNAEIFFFVDAQSYSLLQYNKNITLLSGYDYASDIEFDLVINYTQTIESCLFANSLKSKKILGFTHANNQTISVNSDAQDFIDIILHKNITTKHVLQLIYRVANMRWRGQGYNLAYFPQSKKNKHKTGVLIKNDKLKTYICENLHLEYSKLQTLSLKENLFRQIDEINKCTNIITDDLFVCHAAIWLRKNVQFLDTNNLGYKIEFFGTGKHHRITDYDFI
jgi:hypothetical protein